VSEDVNQRMFFGTAKERYRIMLNKWLQSGGPTARSFTNDPIFQEFRFCNVFREDDKVTQWFRENIREFMRTPVDHLRAAVVFRWFNLPATGELLKPWLMGKATMDQAEEAIAQQQRDGKTILNAAYMIKSPPGLTKTAGIFSCIRIIPFDHIAASIMEENTLEHAVNILCTTPYLGPFMAYQSVCDLRFTPVLENAVDKDYWTSPGPGSARGIGRIFFDDPKTYNYNSERDRIQIMERMRYLLELSRMPDMWPQDFPRWELSTVQHWCCEYDKYMRVFLKEGTPKQKYRPAK
jgi:hypothetical protein